MKTKLKENVEEGSSRGNTLKEIEEITKKMSKKEALDLVKKKAG